MHTAAQNAGTIAHDQQAADDRIEAARERTFGPDTDGLEPVRGTVDSDATGYLGAAFHLQPAEVASWPRSSGTRANCSRV